MLPFILTFKKFVKLRKIIIRKRKKVLKLCHYVLELVTFWKKKKKQKEREEGKYELSFVGFFSVYFFFL